MTDKCYVVVISFLKNDIPSAKSFERGVFSWTKKPAFNYGYNFNTSLEDKLL